MKVFIDPPPEMEAQVTLSERRTVVQPTVLKGQHIVRVGYLTAEGAGGAKSRGVVSFNTRTGEFSLQKLDDTTATVEFDLPKNEFERRRQARSKAGTQNPKPKEGADAAPAHGKPVH